VRFVAAVLSVPLLLTAGCTATSLRTYDEPLAYTRFAAQDACATAGFQLTRVEEVEIQGERPVRLGLLVGQGNEHIRVRMAPEGAGTRVEITSRKRFIGFLAGRHQHERVAGHLDAYIVEDQALRARILGAGR
jgi:hypothetical protein